MESIGTSAALFECVPNFSIGSDPDVLGQLLEQARSVAGVLVLDHSQDHDHGRAVVTLAGSKQALAEAAFRLVDKAAQLIDLTRHRGVHPHMGATDVLPFIPLRPDDRAQAVALAHGVGTRIGEQLGIPVFFYGAAAERPGRTLLANVRRGGFKHLGRAIGSDRSHDPDRGPRSAIHPTAGATAVGVRPFLIAFNVELASDRIETAQEIAGLIREKNGGLPGVRALGFPLASRGLVQVSMNLTDYERTGFVQAFDAIERLAGERGVAVSGSELVGLAPAAALNAEIAKHVKLVGFSPTLHLFEERLSALQMQSDGGDPLAAPAPVDLE